MSGSPHPQIGIEHAEHHRDVANHEEDRHERGMDAHPAMLARASTEEPQVEERNPEQRHHPEQVEPDGDDVCCAAPATLGGEWDSGVLHKIRDAAAK